MANQTCNPAVITQALGIQATGPRTVIVPADPIIWDEETSYEYLTLVASTGFGQGYVSKKDVPAGTSLTDTDYWIPVASFNAQLGDVQNQVATVTQNLNSEIERAKTAEAANASAASSANENANGRAPKVHASSNPGDYGQATGSLYGHVKLSDSPSSSDSASGVAATPKAVSNAVSTKEPLRDIIVTFGDSWGDHSATTDAVWPQTLADAENCELKNFCVNAAGFTLGATTIANEVNTAISSLTADEKSRIKCVVIVAGVNDWRGSANSDTLYNSIRSVITMINNNLLTNGGFGIFIPNMAFDINVMQYRLWVDAPFNYSFGKFSCSNMFGWFNKECYNSDNLHLSQNYNRLLGTYIHGLIHGVTPMKRVSAATINQSGVQTTIEVIPFDTYAQYRIAAIYNIASDQTTTIDASGLYLPIPGYMHFTGNRTNLILGNPSSEIAYQWNPNNTITCRTVINGGANKEYNLLTSFDVNYLAV